MAATVAKQIRAIIKIRAEIMKKISLRELDLKHPFSSSINILVINSPRA
jgi:hypothetical protein